MSVLDHCDHEAGRCGVSGAGGPASPRPTLDEYLRDHPVPGGRPCSVCAFFLGRQSLRDEIVAGRKATPPRSWERMLCYLRDVHGATFSWFALRAHFLNHERGVR